MITFNLYRGWGKAESWLASCRAKDFAIAAEIFMNLGFIGDDLHIKMCM